MSKRPKPRITSPGQASAQKRRKKEKLKKILKLEYQLRLNKAKNQGNPTRVTPRQRRARITSKKPRKA